MFIIKCDLCKKEIKDKQQVIGLSLSWNRFDLCGDCSKPTYKFLDSKKLLGRDEKLSRSDLTAKQKSK